MIKILIVDDAPLFREKAGTYFRLDGWEAETAENGEQAKEILAQRGNEFDAIILDRALGGGQDGVDVLQWMRKQLSLVDTCVVMVTAYGGLENAIETFKLGAFHYLEKPVELRDLHDVLRAGIALHRAHKMRGELLKTLDGARVLSQVVD